MDDAMLRADCANCAALCCVNLSFQRSALFGFDKAAGTPCSHLDDDDRCRIHAALAESGFAGCAQYDCLGAGQRVTQEIFSGRSWRESPSLARLMSSAFVSMRQVHELLVLLNEAGHLPLSSRQERERSRLLRALDPDGGWSLATISTFDIPHAGAEVRGFLGSLAKAGGILALTGSRRSLPPGRSPAGGDRGPPL